ncbi:MAG: hypothetical protein KAS75_03470 [Planctomycetes bacterium]|nr:hypothetical protein [Planctomycetota bacterium]
MRKTTTLLSLIPIVILLVSNISAGTYSGGTGEPNYPYLISTAEDLNAIGADSNDWDKHFVLTNDIDLSCYGGTSFNMIGIYMWHNPDNKPFTGVFDGNNHTIYNFTHTSTDMVGVGLFSFVDGPNAQIKNLRLMDPNVDAGSGSVAGCLVGSLVGYLIDGTISNCSVEGCRVLGAEPIGGMVGRSEGLITDCYAEGEVIGTYVSDDVGVLLGLNWHGDVANCGSDGYTEGDWDIGGLVGNLSYGTMTNCYSRAEVHGIGAVGGLVGHNYRSTITNCWSTGNVSGDYGVGGLVGENPYSNINNSYCKEATVSGIEQCGGIAGMSSRGSITNCYSQCDVSAIDGYVGGVVGYSYEGNIYHCYSASTLSDGNYRGGFAGYDNYGIYTKCFWDQNLVGGANGIGNTSDPNVIGLPTVEMQLQNTFTDYGWDFVTPIWTIDEGVDYPRLWWEVVAGPVEPVELTDELAEDVFELNLPKGLSNSLLAKLDNAIKLLEDDNDNNDAAAVNLIQAFINAVNAQSGKKISETDADNLIAAAQQIIDLLTSE